MEGSDDIIPLGEESLDGLEGLSQDSFGSCSEKTVVNDTDSDHTEKPTLTVMEKPREFLEERPKPEKQFKLMTHDEKKQWRKTEKSWHQRRREWMRENNVNPATISPKPDSDAKKTDSANSVAQLQQLRKRLKIHSEKLRYSEEKSNTRNTKRGRADRSDNSIGLDRPKKKIKGTASYRDVAENAMKLLIRKATAGTLITKEEASLLAAQLQKVVVEMCLNEKRELLPIITEELELCMVEYTSLQTRVFSTIFVPEPKLELSTLLKVVALLNTEIRTEKWIIRGSKNHEDGSTILHVYMSQEEKKLIEQKQNKLLCGVAYATVRFKEFKTEEGNHHDEPM